MNNVGPRKVKRHFTSGLRYSRTILGRLVPVKWQGWLITFLLILGLFISGLLLWQDLRLAAGVGLTVFLSYAVIWQIARGSWWPADPKLDQKLKPPYDYHGWL